MMLTKTPPGCDLDMPPGNSRQPRCLNAEVVFRELALRWSLAISRTSELRPEQNLSFAPADPLLAASLSFLNSSFLILKSFSFSLFLILNSYFLILRSHRIANEIP